MEGAYLCVALSFPTVITTRQVLPEKALPAVGTAVPGLLPVRAVSSAALAFQLKLLQHLRDGVVQVCKGCNFLLYAFLRRVDLISLFPEIYMPSFWARDPRGLLG